MSPTKQRPTEPPEEQKRQHFRIVYPSVDRPSLQIGLISYPVIDISERGVRFLVDDLRRFPIGSRCAGEVDFRGEERYSIAGVVLRTHDLEVVLSLSTGIPLPKIMQEQRYLLQRYRS